VLGHGSRRISPEKLKMAMAFTGQNKHYEWHKIGPRHFRETARRCGFEGVFDEVLENLVLTIPKALNTVAHKLPAGFPSSVAEPILQGLEKRARLL
jgi:serine/threonine-protein kinase HipA